MKYNKYKEKTYQYWQNEFDRHDDYMGYTTLTGLFSVRNKIIELINDGESLLDVGCATGGTYDHIRHETDKKIKYKGVDYASKFIQHRKRLRPEAEWEVQDARYLKEKDNSWDVVLHFGAMDNTTGIKRAIREAKRVAKRLVIIIFWAQKNEQEYVEYMKKIFRNSYSFNLEGPDINHALYIIGEK